MNNDDNKLVLIWIRKKIRDIAKIKAVRQNTTTRSLVEKAILNSKNEPKG